MAGTLFVVATPIGNLEDLTFRALRTLREVDLIAAEDTRRTSKLLAHYDIRKSLTSLREHNEAREIPRLLAKIEAGQSIALVSDAGTPTIADPGARLVRAARAQNIKVVPIPGASAISTALSAVGAPADQFVFLGFPPPKGVVRDRWFEELANEPRTVVFFESPHRILRTLQEARLYLVNRQIVVGRELTKINEIFVNWPIISSPSAPVALTALGEFTVVVEPKVDDGVGHSRSDSDVATLIGQLTNSGAFDEETAIPIAALSLGIPETSVRKHLKRFRIAAKQSAAHPS